MRRETLTDPSLTRLSRPLRQGRQEPKFARLSAPRVANPTAGSETQARMSDMLSASGYQRQPGLATGASPPASVPSRRTAAARLPVGSFLYLAFIGFVAAVTIGVFFGISFFLLAQPKEELAARSGNRDYAARINPSAAGEPSRQRDSNMAQGFAPSPPDRDALTSTATGAAPSDKGPALGSTVSEATSVAPAQPGEARATVDLTRSGVYDSRRDPGARTARHHKHRGHSRQQASEHAAHRFPNSAPSLTPPQVGEQDPFAQRDRNR